MTLKCVLLILGERRVGKQAVNAHISPEDYRCTSTQKVYRDTAIFCSFFLRQVLQELMRVCCMFV